jgi:glycerol-3-phosphate acyltransferase PlsY
MNLIPFLIFVPAAYLLGAIPFGLLIARSRGIDIRTVGSGNIGATNVLRSVGKGWGILTLFLDALKGLIPAAVFPLLAAKLFQPTSPEALSIASACAAILGHSFPVYLKFKGGKGVATTAGALIGIAPLSLLIGFGVFVLVFATSRMVSLGSICASIAIPSAAWYLYRDDSKLVPITLSILGLLIIWRHRANIGRIIRGEENRITFGKKENHE